MSPKRERPDLTQENSPGKLIRAALVISRPKLAGILSAVVFLIALGFGSLRTFDLERLAAFALDNFKLGFQISLTVVSLFMAGFGALASWIKDRLVIAMATIEKPDSGLPFLKFNALSYIATFLYFLGFGSFCVSAYMLTFFVSTFSEPIRYAAILTLLCISCAGYTFVLCQLLTMIYNVFHTYMTSVRWLVENDTSGNPENKV